MGFCRHSAIELKHGHEDNADQKASEKNWLATDEAR